MTITDALSREDCELVVSSGIRTQRDLAAILPVQIREKVKPYLLGQPRHRAALRLLALVETVEWWHAVVSNCRIDPWKLLDCLTPFRSHENRDRVLIEAAVSFIEPDRFHLPVAFLAGRFDDEDFLAFVDALRLTREGLPE